MLSKNLQPSLGTELLLIVSCHTIVLYISYLTKYILISCKNYFTHPQPRTKWHMIFSHPCTFHFPGISKSEDVLVCSKHTMILYISYLMKNILISYRVEHKKYISHSPGQPWPSDTWYLVIRVHFHFHGITNSDNVLVWSVNTQWYCISVIWWKTSSLAIQNIFTPTAQDNPDQVIVAFTRVCFHFPGISNSDDVLVWSKHTMILYISYLTEYYYILVIIGSHMAKNKRSKPYWHVITSNLL